MHIFGEKIQELELGKERQKQTSRSESVENTSKNRTSQSPRKEVIKPSQILSIKSKKQRSYATVTVIKLAQTQTKPLTKVSYKKSSEQPWIKVSYRTCKSNMKKSNSTIQQEQLGRKVLFPQNTGQEKSEANLMLALNEALQQAGKETFIYCVRVRYTPSGTISALFSEKTDAGQLISGQSNLLIRAVKAVDSIIVEIEILEYWQWLKVHRMPLERYLEEGKMKLLRRNVESATEIQLKGVPQWLISKNRLREQQESSNKRGSAIVITASNENEAKKLCASRLQFGGIVKVIEKY